MLVGLIAQGDQTAFSQFMGIHLKPLTVFATRFLANRDDGEDVAQQVFADVWQKAATFDATKASAKTWLFGIARNRCIDTMRKKNLRRLVGLDDVVHEIREERPTALQTVEGRQEFKRTVEAVNELPYRQRLALLMSVVADLPMRDIASAMKTSEGAVEQLLVRARKTLRHKVEHVGDAE